MKRKSFTSSPCSIARSLDILGDWWNPLILRECLYGNSRFDELQKWLGVSRNILTRRLARLVEEELLVKNVYQNNPVRYEYQLTEKGYDACQVLLILMKFGERWYFEENQYPIELRDRTTGKLVHPVMVDANTGKPINSKHLVPCPGLGFKAPKSVFKHRFREYYEMVNQDRIDDNDQPQ